MKEKILIFLFFILFSLINCEEAPKFTKEELLKMDHDELEDLLFQRDVKCDKCIGALGNTNLFKEKKN
jgi:hypothetical protein